MKQILTNRLWREKYNNISTYAYIERYLISAIEK